MMKLLFLFLSILFLNSCFQQDNISSYDLASPIMQDENLASGGGNTGGIPWDKPHFPTSHAHTQINSTFNQWCMTYAQLRAYRFKYPTECSVCDPQTAWGQNSTSLDYTYFYYLNGGYHISGVKPGRILQWNNENSNTIMHVVFVESVNDESTDPNESATETSTVILSDMNGPNISNKTLSNYIEFYEREPDAIYVAKNLDFSSSTSDPVSDPAPSAPIISFASPVDNKPQIMWSSVTYANNYKVYRKEGNSGTWDLVGITSSLELVDNDGIYVNRPIGDYVLKTYYYKATAENDTGASGDSNVISNSFWVLGIQNPF